MCEERKAKEKRSRAHEAARRALERRNRQKELGRPCWSVARGRTERRFGTYVAIYERLSRDKSLYMRPHRGGPLYETPSGAPHGITLIPLSGRPVPSEKSHYTLLRSTYRAMLSPSRNRKQIRSRSCRSQESSGCPCD